MKLKMNKGIMEWKPIGTDKTSGWYFKDPWDELEAKIENFKEGLCDEKGEPLEKVVEFFEGRLCKKP